MTDDSVGHQASQQRHGNNAFQLPAYFGAWLNVAQLSGATQRRCYFNIVSWWTTCEKRIIHFRAADGRAALRHAKKRGRQAEHRWKNKDGNPVFFEFVGVRDLIACDPACEPDEVWYQIVELVMPMERRNSLIPPESTLCAIRNRE